MTAAVAITRQVTTRSVRVGRTGRMESMIVMVSIDAA